MPDFSTRCTDDEIMDDLNISGPVVGQTLRELNTINKWLGGNHISISGLNLLYQQTPEEFKKRQIHIADLGCGGGDIMKEMVHWARRKGLKVKLTGIDANANIIDYARQNLQDFPETTEKVMDIWSSEFKSMEFDIIHCSLFLHHFSQSQLKSMFNSFKQQARLGIVVNDLQRHLLAYYSIKLLTRVFSKSYMVRYDAPLSVARAFSRDDLEEIAQDNSLHEYYLRWKWAFRWQMVVPTLKA